MRHIFGLILLVVAITPLLAQPSKRDAKKAFKNGDFCNSCEAYSKIITPSFDLEKHLILAGRSCYQCGKLQQSLEHFQRIRSTQKRYDEELDFFEARTLHGLGQYQEALAMYKAFLRNNKPKHDLYEEASLLILQAWKGSLVELKERQGLVQNAGSPVNTAYNEINPIPSPTVPDKFYYAKADASSTGSLRNEEGKIDPLHGHFRYDIYSAELVAGQWEEHHPTDPSINSNQNEIVIDFSDDGQVIYFERFLSEPNSSVLVDTFSAMNEALREQVMFSGPLRLDDQFDIWEDSLIVFSSGSLGGFGGKDLYMSLLKPNGQWSAPKNLGSEVNSSYDEVFPFLSGDGTQLYFSSNGASSTGGFDVLKSSFDVQNDRWSSTENMGEGINSYHNDLAFRVSADGQIGMLCSDRPGGKGEMDIYLVYFNNPVIAQLRIPVYDALRRHVLPKTRKTKPAKDATANAIQKQSENRIGVPEFYRVEEDFMERDENLVKVDRLVSVLNRYPKSLLVLNAHSSRDKPDAQALFLSAVHASTLKEALVKRGIGEDQIIIKSFGKKQPVIRAIGPTVSNIETKYNNRITTRLVSHPDDPVLPVAYDKAEVKEELKVDDLRNTITGLNYRVEVKRTEQMLADVELTTQPNLIIQQHGTGPYVYVLEGYTTFEEAKKSMIVWRSKGYLSSEILPYVGERLIRASSLKEMSAIYPDLTHYLSEN